VRAWSPRWPGDAHAGRTETSVQLALDAARVRPGAAAGNTEPVRALLPALRAGGVRAVSANGVLGDPAGASAAEGEALLDAATAELVTLVEQW
jgi:creatinine amidohydrolase